MDLNELHGLVSNFTHENNEIRNAAEEKYKLYSAEVRFVGLCQLLSLEINDDAKVMSLVLIRRLVASEFCSFWPNIDENTQQAILQMLIQLGSSDISLPVRTKLILVIGQIAHEFVDEETSVQKWRAVIDFLSFCAQSNDINFKCSALQLIEACADIFGADLYNYLPAVKRVFEEGLTHESTKVRVNAVKALVALLIDYDEDDQVLKQLQSLVPAIIDICVHVVKTDEDDDSALQCLADLAATIPKLLYPHITTLFNTCLEIARNTEVSECFRSSALESIVAFIESAPKTTKKHQALLPAVVSCCLAMMTELEDELEEWLTSTDEDDEDAEEVAMTGESSLDRIASALPGNVFLPHFQSVVVRLNADGDWRSKHAMLRSISTIGEGCRRQMEAKIDMYMKVICPFSKHPHPRVRYACCNAIGQMSTDFSPKIQKKSHATIVPAIITCLENLEVPKVASHAASALINFCEGCPQNIMSGYLPMIMKKLTGVLEISFQQLSNKQMKELVEQVVTAIASVAESAQELFKTYYSDLIRPLFFILEKSDNQESKELRGKTIECITFIGSAVGKEMFHADAIQIMNMLSTVFQTMSVEDTEYMYMISSWTRFCTILGTDFAPFLPIVMQPVMRAATYNVDVGVIDSEETSTSNEYSYTDIGNGNVVRLRTTGIEEKATACDMLVCYARHMKEHFIQYVGPVTEAMLKNLNFVFNDGVRTSSAEVMGALIDCVSIQGVQAQQNLASLFIPALKEAIMKENDIEVSGEFIGVLSGIIGSLKTEGLTQSYVSDFVELINHEMQNYIEFKVKYDASEDDEEDTASNDDLEMFSSYLAHISDFIHSLLKYTKGTVYSSCQSLFTISMSLIQSQKTYFERQWGICILIDFIEFVDVNIGEIFPTIFQCLRSLLIDEFAEVRQAAAYGIGVLSVRSHVSPMYIQEAIQSIPTLISVIEAKEARGTMLGITATENAISAVVKILQNENTPTIYNSDDVDARFSKWLPVFEDKMEAIFTYNYFYKLYTQKNQLFFGPNNTNLPKILSCALIAMTMENFEDSEGVVIKNQMLEIVKDMYQNSPPEYFQSIVESAKLNANQQAMLQKIFQ